MSGIYLRLPGFTYSSWKPFTKNKGYKETGDSQYICQNKLDKACFQHDTAYGDYIAFTRRKASAKILGDKVFNISKSC